MPIQGHYIIAHQGDSGCSLPDLSQHILGLAKNCLLQLEQMFNIMVMCFVGTFLCALRICAFVYANRQ